MKKTVIFLVTICLGLTLLTPAPAKAQVDPLWPVSAPLYAAGAILSLPFQIVGSLFYPPSYYYPASPVVYGGGYGYYGPAYGYYGGYYGPGYGYYGGYHGGYYGGHYRGGYHGGYRGGHHGYYHGGYHHRYRR